MTMYKLNPKDECECRCIKNYGKNCLDLDNHFDREAFELIKSHKKQLKIINDFQRKHSPTTLQSIMPIVVSLLAWVLVLVLVSLYRLME